MQPDRLGTSEWTPPSDFSERYPYADGKFWIGRSPTDDTALGYDDDRHICLVSGNRGGKGTATIIPNLCLWPGSAIIIDPKGENATITAARRGPGSAVCEGMGQRVYVLDPFEKAQVDSSLRGRFNPFDALDPDNPRTIDDAAKLADSIVVTNPESKDPFWDESARAMVRALILHVLTSPDFEGRRNLLTLREVVLHGDRLRAEKLRELGETNIPSSQSLLWHGVSKNESFNGIVSGIGTRFRDMALSSAKQFDSVLQVVDRNTEFLDSPGMRSVLEASDFSLRDLKTDPKGVSVYLSLPQSFMNTHFRWLRMMLALFVAEMEHVPGNKGANGHRILVCMDEFAGLRRMEFIETAVSQIAGFGVKLFFVLQSLEQLKATYEKSWETFLANAGLKIFYSVGDQFTRKYISEYIGDTEITREMKSEAEMNGWNTGESWGSSTSESEQHSKTTSENWGTSTNESQSASGGSSDSWESMPLFLRNTGGFFAGLAGNRGASRNSGWQKGSGTGTQSGGGVSENVGGSRTTTENEGGSRGASGSSTITHSENLHKRPLITPDEIGRFFGRIDEAEFPFYPGCSLVLVEGKQPAVVRKSNYYEDWTFSRIHSPHPDHGSSALTVRHGKFVPNEVIDLLLTLDSRWTYTRSVVDVRLWNYRRTPYRVRAGDVILTCGARASDSSDIYFELRSPWSGTLLGVSDNGYKIAALGKKQDDIQRANHRAVRDFATHTLEAIIKENKENAGPIKKLIGADPSAGRRGWQRVYVDKLKAIINELDKASPKITSAP